MAQGTPPPARASRAQAIESLARDIYTRLYCAAAYRGKALSALAADAREAAAAFYLAEPPDQPVKQA